MQYYQLIDSEKIYQSACFSLGNVISLRPTLLSSLASYYPKHEALKYKNYFASIGITVKVVPYDSKTKRYKSPNKN